MSENEKLFVFDMDGTIIEEEVIYNGEILPSRWTQIAMSLGDDAYQPNFASLIK